MGNNKTVKIIDVLTGNELYSVDDWIRAEFLKTQIDSQFTEQFSLELKIEPNKGNTLIQFSELTNAKIEMTINDITQVLDKATATQYLVRPTRDNIALTEKLVFSGELLDINPS